MIAVIAFGGNALLRPHDKGTHLEQLSRAEKAAGWVEPLLTRGYHAVVVHGNGPQVGNILIQMEAASNQIPPAPLDVADAMTEGSMGYLLETAFHNTLNGNGRKVSVTTLLTPVAVDPDDPAFTHPTKPIGPFYTMFRAHQLMDEMAWKMVEDAGRGWRKVVPSPKPQKILNMEIIREQVKQRDVVIAGGGGGIPVIEDKGGQWSGTEAVIDKDYTASLIARNLDADLFIILTGVPKVYLEFGTPNERPLPILPVEEAKRLHAEGQFPPGSMGPKINAAIQFVAATGKEVLITEAGALSRAIEGKDGTIIKP